MTVPVWAPALDATFSTQRIGFGVADSKYLPIDKVTPAILSGP